MENLFLAVVAICLLPHSLHAADIQLTADPLQLIPVLAPSLTVTCQPGPAVDNYREVYYLQLTKEERGEQQAVASLRAGQAPAQYRCEIEGLGPDGEEVYKSAVVNVTVHPQSEVANLFLKVIVSTLREETEAIQQQTTQVLAATQQLENEIAAKRREPSKSSGGDPCESVPGGGCTQRHGGGPAVQGGEPVAEVPGKRVAFSVTERTEKNYGAGVQVLFETVELNEGNGYNVSTSIFSPPLHGVYFLSSGQLTHDTAAASVRAFSLKTGLLDQHQSPPPCRAPVAGQRDVVEQHLQQRRPSRLDLPTVQCQHHRPAWSSDLVTVVQQLAPPPPPTSSPTRTPSTAWQRASTVTSFSEFDIGTCGEVHHQPQHVRARRDAVGGDAVRGGRQRLQHDPAAASTDLHRGPRHHHSYSHLDPAAVEELPHFMTESLVQLRSTIEDLKSQAASLVNRANSLRVLSQNITQELEQVNQEYRDLANEFVRLQSNAIAVTTVLDKASDVVSDLSYLRPKQKVAFHAAMSTLGATSAELNVPLIFDYVMTNEGQGYDSFTGIFSPPVDGTYLLTASLESGSGMRPSEVSIKVDGRIVQTMQIADDTDYEHSSVTTIVALAAKTKGHV
ncbi:hypothetical protein C0Q70_00399 [Pomacea canaliculata]|uniref:C1q domain-containing protein n=2 Tax=Pomacea canaliculata TaxID=400727 RepID=A0A2T7PWN0_POMCA|nr:hypothetical protein C0Q70_00399 [Pomacea canaliculata]